MMSDSAEATGDDSGELRRAVQAVYQDLARAVAEAGPVCDLSGRCCRFTEWDHTLFLSEIEAELLIAEAPPSARPLDDGATCPWQDDRGRCTARDARPLGCRVYYCDPNYQETAHDLSATYLGHLRAISDKAGRPWNYAPLHTHLRRAKASGAWTEVGDAESGRG